MLPARKASKGEHEQKKNRQRTASLATLQKDTAELEERKGEENQADEREIEEAMQWMESLI